MSGPIIRSGPSPEFSKKWESVFGKQAASRTASAAKKPAKKKAAKKATKKKKR